MNGSVKKVNVTPLSTSQDNLPTTYNTALFVNESNCGIAHTPLKGDGSGARLNRRIDVIVTHCKANKIIAENYITVVVYNRLMYFIGYLIDVTATTTRASTWCFMVVVETTKDEEAQIYGLRGVTLCSQCSVVITLQPVS